MARAPKKKTRRQARQHEQKRQAEKQRLTQQRRAAIKAAVGMCGVPQTDEPSLRQQQRHTVHGDDPAPMTRHTCVMRPPSPPRSVRCMHCEQIFGSDTMHWEPVDPQSITLGDGLLKGSDRKPHPEDELGQWMCGTPGCDGAGYLWDLFPVSPDGSRDESVAAEHQAERMGDSGLKVVSQSFDDLFEGLSPEAASALEDFGGSIVRVDDEVLAPRVNGSSQEPQRPPLAQPQDLPVPPSGRWSAGAFHFDAGDPETARGPHRGRWIPCVLDAEAGPLVLGFGHATEADALETLPSLLADLADLHGPPTRVRISDPRLAAALQAAEPLPAEPVDTDPEFDAYAAEFNAGYLRTREIQALDLSPEEAARRILAADGMDKPDPDDIRRTIEALHLDEMTEPAELPEGGTGTMLDVPTLDDARIKAFARAAAELHRVAPWDGPIAHRLFRLRPATGAAAPPGFGWVSCSRGAEEVPALWFTDDPADPVPAGGWRLCFTAAEEVPVELLAYWTDRGLPMPGGRLPELLASHPDGMLLPSPVLLVHARRLCEALSRLDPAHPDAVLEVEELRLEPAGR